MVNFLKESCVISNYHKQGQVIFNIHIIGVLVAKYNEDDIYRYVISLYLYALCAGLNRNLEATGPGVPQRDNFG